MFIYNIYFCTYCYSILQWQQLCWWCELHVALSMGLWFLKVHLIYSSCRVLQEVRMLKKRAPEPHFIPYSSSFFMICVCECGGVQVCNCLQWGWGTGFAEILQNPSGSLDRISLPAAAADIVHVTALKEILSIPPSPAYFLLCTASRFESLLSPFLFIKPAGFKCFSMFSFLYVFHTSLFKKKAEVSEATQAHGVKLPSSTDLYTFALWSSHDRPSKLHKVIY